MILFDVTRTFLRDATNYTIQWDLMFFYLNLCVGASCTVHGEDSWRRSEVHYHLVCNMSFASYKLRQWSDLIKRLAFCCSLEIWSGNFLMRYFLFGIKLKLVTRFWNILRVVWSTKWTTFILSVALASGMLTEVQGISCIYSKNLLNTYICFRTSYKTCNILIMVIFATKKNL